MELKLFDDVLAAGLIQPYKEVYGKPDLMRLMKYHSEENAKWILICSAAFHYHTGKECRVTKSAR